VSLFISLNIKKGLEGANQWVKENLPGKIKEYLPGEMRIEKGKLAADFPQPFIKEASKGEFAFIVDTTGKITSLDGYKNGILLTQDKIITKAYKGPGRVEIEKMDIKEIGDSLIIQPGDEEKGEIIRFISPPKSFVLSYDLIERWSKIAYKILFFPFLIFVFLYYLISKLLQVMLFSLVSLSARAFYRIRLSYENLLNIGIYTLTPITLLAVLFILANIRVPFFPLIYILVYSMLLILGVSACRVEE